MLVLKYQGNVWWADVCVLEKGDKFQWEINHQMSVFMEVRGMGSSFISLQKFQTLWFIVQL